MSLSSEFELATIPCDEVSNRVVVCMKTTDQGSVFVIQRQSFSQHVGWFVQSEIEVTKKEFAALRSTVPANANRCAPSFSAHENASGSAPQQESTETPLDILKFPSAVAS